MLMLFSCGSLTGTRSINAVDRPATDVPAQFEAPAGLTLGDNACKSPLLDPRDGTEIKLFTSYGEGVGDY